MTRIGQNDVIKSDLFVMAGLCLSVLYERGYTFEDTVIDDELVDEMLSRGRHPPSPALSHLVNDFSDANSRWTLLRHEGRLIGTLGFRFDDLGSTSLGGHLERSFRRHYGGETSTNIRKDAPSVLHRLVGPTIYVGDLWHHPDYRGDPPKTTCFSVLSHALGFAQWPSAKYMYAFHWRRHALSGKVDQYGFVSGVIRGAQIWTNPPEGRDDTEQLSFLTREDWEADLPYLVMNPQELTDPQVPPSTQGERKSS